MTPLWPTADHVAFAVVITARRLNVDPIALLEKSGFGWDPQLSRARIYAALALRRVFDDGQTPGGPGNVAFSRMVGGNKIMLTAFDNSHRRKAHYWFRPEFLTAIARALVLSVERNALVSAPARKTRLIESIELRRAPAKQVEVVTESLMGDPPLQRSAFAEYVEREHLRQEAARREAEEAQDGAAFEKALEGAGLGGSDACP